MNERIKALRKELGYTQQAFADELKIARGNIGAYEVGKNAPSDAVISLICEKFNVNENWLRTGEGEMLIKLSRQKEIAKLSADLFKAEEESFKSRLIMALASMNDDEWRMLENLADKIANRVEGE